jgi:hypothetical protein
MEQTVQKTPPVHPSEVFFVDHRLKLLGYLLAWPNNIPMLPGCLALVD